MRAFRCLRTRGGSIARAIVIAMALHEIAAAKSIRDYDLLNESSLNRCLAHVKKSGEKSFAILTSWRTNRTNKENNAKFSQLKNDVRSSGYGYIKLIGHWAEEDNDESGADDGGSNKELSMFVIGMTKEEAKSAMLKYKQDAVVYAGPDTGGKVMLLTPDGETQLGAFNPGKIAAAYSEVRGSPFVFECLE